MNIILKTGLLFGDEPQTEVTLRELTTGDMLDAELAAERLVQDKNGNPVLVVSQTLFSYELLRRQIASVGKIQGPISLGQVRQLSPDDLALINAALSLQEQAKAEQVVERGRLAATGEDI